MWAFYSLVSLCSVFYTLGYILLAIKPIECPFFLNDMDKDKATDFHDWILILTFSG